MLTKNILLLDDHMVIRTGLRSMLQDYYPHIEIFEAQNGDGALAILKKGYIDLLVTDLLMPGTDSVGMIEVVSIKYPRTYILVFSMLAEKIYARRVMRAGANGYLPKDSPYEEMRRAFDLAMNNKKYLSQSLVELFSADMAIARTSNPFEMLSHREFEILNLLLRGNNITSIGKSLNIKPSTVGTYKTRVFQKLNVDNIFELKEMSMLYDLNLDGVN